MDNELTKLIQEKTQINISNLELIAKSSNRLYCFESEDKKYIVKTPNLSLSNLSPYWRQLKDIFVSDFSTQAGNMHSLVGFLSKNPYIYLPKLIYAQNGEITFQVFEYINGQAYESDEFPENKNISYQLGEYMGWIQTKKFKGFGIYDEKLKLEDSSHFIDRVLRSMANVIERYWKSNGAVTDFYRNIEKIIPDDLGSFGLIMPDISANQFVYSEDMTQINAVVDLDSYVIGPINLELTVLEMCIKNYGEFKKGYERYLKMPDFNPFRSFYRFYMYLNDPDNTMPLKDFLNTGILFD